MAYDNRGRWIPDEDEFKPNIPNLNIPQTPGLTEEERQRAIHAAANQPGGGFISSGNRQMLVTPTGTATNFPTDRDVGIELPPGQQAPLGAVSTPATRPMQPAPVPQPTYPALTTNTQVDAEVLNAMKGIPIDKTTGQPVISSWEATQLGFKIQRGGKEAAEAQRILQEKGISATSDILTNVPPEITRMKEMKTRLTPVERKIVEQDRTRANVIRTQLIQQREQAYQEDVRKMAYDTAQAKLGVEKLRSVEIQGQIDLDAETLLGKQLEREIKGIELQDIKEMRELINPDTVKANELAGATSVEEYKQTWDEGMRLSSRYGFPEPVRNQLHLGVLASSYDSPVELAKDVEGMKDFPEDVIGVRGGDVAKYMPDIQEAIFNNLPPDQAVEQILKDSGKEPTDKGYPQLALNIAAGVWKEYKDAGEAARAEAQAKIKISDAQQVNKFVTQATPLVQQAAMPDVVKSILASKRNMMDKLLDKSETALAKKMGYSPGLQKKAFGGVGIIPRLAEVMSPEQIKQDVFDYLIQENWNDKQFVNFMIDQKGKPSSQRDPKLEIFADSIVAPFNEGKKKALEEAEKEQVKRDKIIQDNEKKNLFTEFDDKGNAVEFGTPEEAEQYRRASSWGKEAIAENAKARIRYRLGNEADRTHLENRLDKITARVAADRANIYISEDEKEIRETTNQPIIDEIKAELDRLDRIDVKLITPPPPEDNELPVMTPEEALNAPIGTRFRGIDGRIRTRQ